MSRKGGINIWMVSDVDRLGSAEIAGGLNDRDIAVTREHHFHNNEVCENSVEEDERKRSQIADMAVARHLRHMVRSVGSMPLLPLLSQPLLAASVRTV